VPTARSDGIEKFERNGELVELDVDAAAEPLLVNESFTGCRFDPVTSLEQAEIVAITIIAARDFPVCKIRIDIIPPLLKVRSTLRR
jgi:hypothetical protein